jgi:hypothetical protein
MIEVTKMEGTYSVIIEYHSGKRKDQKIAIEGIDQDDIMNILGEITQDQLANAEIIVLSLDKNELSYENFLIKYMTKEKISH